MTSTLKKVALMGLLLALTLLAYSNTFQGPMHFDDKLNIVSNPIVHDLRYFWPPAEAKSLLLYELFRSRYIGYLTLALNYKLGKLDTVGYHIFNLCVHLANVLLVYLTIALIMRTPLMSTSALHADHRSVALWSAALFALHPIQTQAITYIVQRFTSLEALFALASFAAYAASREQGRKGGKLLYACAILCSILAMKTKENAFTLPMLIALFEVIFHRAVWTERARRLLPIILTMAVIPLSRMQSIDLGGALHASALNSGIPRSDYLMTQFVVVLKYLQLLFLPIGQNLDYDFDIRHSLFEPSVLLSLAALLALAAGAWMLLRQGRKHGGEPAFALMGFGVIWFFLVLSVESSIIPIIDVIFEHRVYMPSVGIIFSVIAALFLIARRTGTARYLPYVLGVVALVLGAATFERNKVWGSELSLWTDVVSKSPMRPRPHVSLGLAYMQQGQDERAMAEFKRALDLRPNHVSKHPDDVDAHYNIGLILIKHEAFLEAAWHLERCVKLTPYDVDAHLNLAYAYDRAGDNHKAVEHLKTAAGLRPYDNKIRYNLAMVYVEVGRKQEALEELGNILSHSPGDTQARMLMDYVKKGGL